MKIVCPCESTAETQPQLQTGFAEIVSDDFPVFHTTDALLFIYRPPLSFAERALMNFSELETQPRMTSAANSEAS